MDHSPPRHNPRSPEAPASEPMSAAASSLEDKCPICLDDYQDKAFITVCFHAFCFDCVVRAASMTGNVCPLCKVKYYKVIHNVKANDNYDTHKISRFQKPEDSSSSEIRIMGTLRARAAISRTVTAASGGRSSRKTSLHTRRCVYSSNVRARLPDPANGRARRVRDISASFFSAHPASTHRLVPWLNREIEALLGAEHVSFIVRLIISIIERVDLESEEFPSHLYGYLDSRTSHFMHEFISYARSPYDMIAYDQKVQYDWPHGVPMETRTGSSSSLITGASSSSSQLPDSNLPSTSSGVASVDVDPGTMEMRHRLFQELTSEEGVSVGVASSHSSPLRFCNSPIMIHGSSSEDEDDGHQQRPVLEYRDSNYPTYSQAIHIECATADVSVDGMANTTSQTTHLHGNISSSSNADVPPSQASTRLDSQELAEEPVNSMDQIELFVPDDDAGTYSRIAEGLLRDDRGKQAQRNTPKKTKSKGMASSTEELEHDEPSEESLEEESQLDCHQGGYTSKDTTERSGDGVGEKHSIRHRHPNKLEKTIDRQGQTSEVYDRGGKVGSPRSGRKIYLQKDRSRSRSSHRNRSHSRSDSSFGSRKTKDRGKGKLGSSLKDDCRKKSGRLQKVCSPVVIISDSDSEREHYHHHHHYHHHTHKHKHKHKHKKKARKHKKETCSGTSSQSGMSHSIPNKELLMQESQELEEEIRQSKREILKSSLRKERIELLHSCLHGQCSPGRDICGTGRGDHEEGKAKELHEEELEARLAGIDRNIVEKKQQLLKVMTSLEQIQQNDD